jgi:transcriptional regulator with XRE-family HTH domain
MLFYCCKNNKYRVLSRLFGSFPSCVYFDTPRLKTSTKTIGQRIARYRKDRGLTQQELADQIGISRKLVTDYERGKVRLFDEMLSRFALTPKVTADALLGLKNIDYLEPSPSLRVMKRLQEIEKLPEIKKGYSQNNR